MPEPRKRAPSQKSLQTKAKILDAAEQLFAERGFEGASIRDIAGLADVQVGLVHHHSGGKEELFRLTVARRAGELSRLRLEQLEALKQAGTVTLEGLLDCFISPYVLLVHEAGPHWLAYGRLVAHVSADPRWRGIAAECFDPTAGRFINEIQSLYPESDRQSVAAGQVYTVAAMLAFLTSGWRVEALHPGGADLQARQLIRFCAAGIEAMLNVQQT